MNSYNFPILFQCGYQKCMFQRWFLTKDSINSSPKSYKIDHIKALEITRLKWENSWDEAINSCGGFVELFRIGSNTNYEKLEEFDRVWTSSDIELRNWFIGLFVIALCRHITLH